VEWKVETCNVCSDEALTGEPCAQPANCVHRGLVQQVHTIHYVAQVCLSVKQVQSQTHHMLWL